MPTNRQIVFTSRKVPNNSFTMRGEQMAAELRRQGYNSICLKPCELAGVHDSIVVWVRRTHNLGKLRRLKSNGNYQLLDILDRLYEGDIYKRQTIEYMDGILFASATTYKQYHKDDKLNNKDKYWLVHHADPALKVREYNRFQLGYWGYRTSALHVNNVIPPKYKIRSARTGEYPADNWFNNVSCHYSVRDYQRGLGWRPATKIATAAACGANIIVSREPIAMELLPGDYPYFVDSYDVNSVRSMIRYANATYGNEIWQYGLRCMAGVRTLTNIHKSAKLFGRIVDEIDAKHFNKSNNDSK